MKKLLNRLSWAGALGLALLLFSQPPGPVFSKPVKADIEFQIKPFLSCVEPGENPGETVAYFGYESFEPEVKTIVVGADNRFLPPPADRKQPVLYFPGYHEKAFRVAFTTASINWIFNSISVVALPTAPRCAPVQKTVAEIVPFVESITVSNGTATVSFGYQNSASNTVTLAAGIGLYLWQDTATAKLVTDIMVPFHKHPVAVGVPLLGLGLTIVAIVGSSNAVNLTDGMDGLAIGCTLIVSVVFLVTTYLAGNIKAATYLQIPHVNGAGELTIFCSALIGAGLGFLWFNCHPAQMFMGDTGSLALGGALGMMAVLVHQPFLLFIAGGVFVGEALSVMVQRSWFKWTRYRTGTGRRVFLMAPIHHHFEKKGWAETQVVARFYILGVLCAVIALGSLKVR